LIRKSAVAAALLLVLAAGCGGSGAVTVDSPSSPLGAGGSFLQECVPDPSGTTMTDGFTVLDNQSKGTVIIERVSFYGDQHLQLLDAVVVPIQDDSIGAWVGWPPGPYSIDQPGVQWDKRVPAVGARVPPSSANSFRNLVIETRPTARKEGIAAGVQVLYRENGSQYELRAGTEFEVLIAKSC
jgi:hypothetical protein